MRFVLCVLFSVLFIAPARAQQPSPTTQTGTVTKGTNKVYTFVPATFGQITATMSWDTQGANLVMVLACGSADAMIYGVAAGLLDRFARFESGVIGGNSCALAVSSADQTANFRLHLIRSGDQFVTPAAASGFVALTEARDGTLVGDVAVRALNRVKEAVR